MDQEQFVAHVSRPKAAAAALACFGIAGWLVLLAWLLGPTPRGGQLVVGAVVGGPMLAGLGVWMLWDGLAGGPLLVIDREGIFYRRFRVGKIPWSAIGTVGAYGWQRTFMVHIEIKEQRYLPKSSVEYTQAPRTLPMRLSLMTPPVREAVAFLERIGRLAGGGRARVSASPGVPSAPAANEAPRFVAYLSWYRLGALAVFTAILCTSAAQSGAAYVGLPVALLGTLALVVPLAAAVAWRARRLLHGPVLVIDAEGILSPWWIGPQTIPWSSVIAIRAYRYNWMTWHLLLQLREGWTPLIVLGPLMHPGAKAALAYLREIGRPAEDRTLRLRGHIRRAEPPRSDPI
jgi:hypothetical protein